MKLFVGILCAISLSIGGHNLLFTNLLECNNQSDRTCGNSNSVSPVLDKGDRLPSFEVTDLASGETISNESMLGSYYLIYFWSMSCGICHREMPYLNDMYEKFRDDNFTILSITVARNQKEVHKHLQENGLTGWHNTFIPPDQEVVRDINEAFGIRGVPHKVLVSPEGEILHVSNGYTGREMKEKYAALIR